MTAHAESLAAALSHDRFTVRAKVLSFLGQKFHVFDPAGQTVAFCKMAAFKLREDITLYAGEAMQTPVLGIKARSIVDFSASYDVTDLTAGEAVGTLRRQGMKSMLRDAWEMLDAAGNVVARVGEDSQGKALARRFVPYANLLLPQAFHGESGGREVFVMRQNFNPLVRKLECDFTADAARTVDRRLGLAAAVLLMAIEGKQSQ